MTHIWKLGTLFKLSPPLCLSSLLLQPRPRLGDLSRDFDITVSLQEVARRVFDIVPSISC